MKIVNIFLAALFFILFVSVSPIHAADTATVTFQAQSKYIVGQNVKVNVFVNSSTLINAVQLKIAYPTAYFSVTSFDSNTSAFGIKAEETILPGLLTVARGTIEPVQGKKLLTVINAKVLKKGASNKLFGYLTADSLVMTVDGRNILSGSVTAASLPTPTPVPTSSGITLITKTVTEFFHGLFGK